MARSKRDTKKGKICKNINILPNEILRKVLRYLDTSTLLNCEDVSQKWKQITGKILELPNMKFPINDLPNEMLTKIFGYLNVKQLLQCENVCRRWKYLISTDKSTWAKVKS